MIVSNPNGVNLHEKKAGAAATKPKSFKPQRGKFTLGRNAVNKPLNIMFQTPTG